MLPPNHSIRKFIGFAIIGALFYASLPAIAQQSLQSIKEETQRIQAENKILREQIRAAKQAQKQQREAAEFEKYIQRLNRIRIQNAKLKEQMAKGSDK